MQSKELDQAIAKVIESLKINEAIKEVTER
jgi:hypothetical protein